MNIEVIENQENLQVIIECQKINEQIKRLKSHIELFDDKIQAKSEKEIDWIYGAV